MELNDLTRRICSAVADAENKRVTMKDKDIVMLFGCTGSGKSTLSVYMLGGEFTIRHGELWTPNHFGFAIGSNRASVTRGVSTARVPNAEGLCLVDAAGTGDTAGADAELTGAIYRSKMLQAARSVRIVLVLSTDRVKVSCDRGKHAVRDMDNLAALFQDVNKHLDSIGLVVNGELHHLIESNATSIVVDKICTAMEDLAKNAVANPSVSVGREMEGMKVTPGGVDVLNHFLKHCKKAREITDDLADEQEEVEEDDVACLARLVQKGCAVYPANVLQKDQRQLMLQYLKNLTPVACPSAFRFSLPIECENEVQTFLNKELANVRGLLG